MENTKEKKQYEVSFVSADEDGAKKLTDYFRKSGAEIIFESPLSKMRLAQPINKKNEAYFGFLHLDAEPEEISKAERQLRIHPGVLRFLVVTPPLVKQKERSQYEPRKRQFSAARPEKKHVPHISNEALEEQLKEILQ